MSDDLDLARKNTPKPSDWPTIEKGQDLTDAQALVMAKLILVERPKSYVEGAMHLAQYVLNLNLQSEAIERDFDKHDTWPVIRAAPVTE